MLNRRSALIGGLALAPAGAARAQDPSTGIALGSFASGRDDVAAVVFAPRPNAPMSGAGIILLNGGGGTNNDLPRFQRSATAMADRGYVVVMPNYLGITPEPGPGNRATWIQSVVDCADWLMADHGVGTGRVAVMGFSRGGWLATETAVTRPGFACAVGIASGGDLPVDRIAHRPPVLLLYADADPVVPPESTRAWHRRLRAAGVPAEIQVVDSPNHVFEPSEWRDLFGRAERFARPHLG